MVKNNCKPLFSRDLMKFFEIQCTNFNILTNPSNLMNISTEIELKLLIKYNE